jgi:hypothetical protein
MNTALGGGEYGVDYGALGYNTTGAYNTAVGHYALKSNTTASNNTAVGYQAGYANTGGNNTAIGQLALYANTSASNNTAVGLQAVTANTTGSQIVALGERALYTNTTGAYNTALGAESLYFNTTASNNTAVGYQAGYSFTAPSSGTEGNCTFIGRLAGYSVTNGYSNTFIGQSSGYAVTTGIKNTILGTFDGNQGGLDIRTASNYIVLSDGDGNPRGIFDNSGRLLLGSSTVNANLGATGFQITSAETCAIVLCTDASGQAMRFFSSTTTQAGYITVNGATASYNSASDYRLKENVTQLVDGLNVISKLKPVKYTWKVDGNVGEGFIAHELQESIPLAVQGVKDQVDANGDIDPQGIDQSKIVPYLVSAIQEQQALITSLTARITALEST